MAPEEVFCSPECRKTHAATRTKKTINERELIDGFHHPFWGGLETMGPFSGHPCHGLCAASGQFVPWLVLSAIYLAAVFAGMLALVIPGIWSEEVARANE